MNRIVWIWARLLGGALILVALIWQVGFGPFLDGIRTIDGWSLIAAAGILAVTTACCAWRWQLIARSLDMALPVPAAIAAYYRSQFLNTTLPGGVLGDVHRGVHHGSLTGGIGRGLRSVAWERGAGQAVLVAVALISLVLSPSPARSVMPIVATAVLAVAAGVVLVSRIIPRDGPSLWARAVRTITADFRAISLRAWLGIALLSCLAVSGYIAIFLIAARAAGSTAPLARLLPLVMLMMLAASVPMNVAGFGPREGMAAWSFSAAGLGADQGVATAVAYGVMVFVACLPGAVVLLVGWFRRNPADRGPQRPRSNTERKLSCGSVRPR